MNKEARKFMRIREMKIDDYDDVYDLWINATGMGLNNIDDSIQGIEKYLNRNPKSCFVAMEDNKIIGVIMSGHDGRRGFIYHTAVHINYRKQGVGRQLVESAMRALYMEGINKVALVVFSHNKTGNAFWEKMGFSSRDDLTYRNKNINLLQRIDT